MVESGQVIGAPATTSVSAENQLTVRAWRLYAFLSLIPLAFFASSLIGPRSEGAFAPLKGVDFGAFYAGGLMVRDGQTRQLGEMDAQRATQRRLQEDEHTGWRWYNALPHPPVASIMIEPLTAFSLRTAFWIWAAASLVAAGVAVWLLARALCPAAPLACALVLFSFEPVWDVPWWGQIDSFLLLPVAAGIALLMRGSGRRNDLIAGALCGALALKPIFVPILLLALIWGRRWAAFGMTLVGVVLAGISLVAVGIDGARDYLDLARYYQKFSGSPAIVEWRMYNLRGLAIRLDLGSDNAVRLWLVLTLSAILAIGTISVAGSALRAGWSPDLAIALLTLGMILTAYHVHVQSLVFLTPALAAWMGRSLRPGASGVSSLAWAIPVVAIHGGAMLLRPEKPSPAPSEARIETYLTLVLIAALVIVATILVRPLQEEIRSVRASWRT